MSRTIKPVCYLLIGALLVFPLLSYGTLSPCEMLKKEVKATFLSHYAGDNKTGWEALGSALAFGLGGKMIDEMVETMSPVKCLVKLIDVRFRGAALLEQNSASAPWGVKDTAATASCKVEHFTWRNSRGLEILFLEGVVSPVTTRMIHVQYFDAKDNFLGTSSAPIQPGGSFSTNIDHRNPTDTLKIKYACN